MAWTACVIARCSLSLRRGFAPFSSGSEQAPQGYSVELCKAVAAHIRQLPGLAGLQVRWRAWQSHRASSLGCGRNRPVVYAHGGNRQPAWCCGLFHSGLYLWPCRAGKARRAGYLAGALTGRSGDNGPHWRATINAGLSKHSFAVLRGSLSSRWAQERIRQLGLQSTLEEVSTYEEGVRRVAEHKVDAFFADRVILLALQARQAEREQLLVPDHLFVMSRVALPMRRGDDEFRLLVDSALSKALAGAEGEALFVRYLGPLSDQDRLLQSLYPLPD